MKIQLDNDFSIEGDSNSYTLKYKHRQDKLNSRGENIYTRDYWYYPTIKLCLEAYLDKSPTGSTSVEQVLAKFEEVKQVINKLKL